VEILKAKQDRVTTTHRSYSSGGADLLLLFGYHHASPDFTFSSCSVQPLLGLLHCIMLCHVM
jgi:hypothetical protein